MLMLSCSHSNWPQWLPIWTISTLISPEKVKIKKMHVLELGFLCSNFFKLYFCRFAWDLSSVQTSNAFGQKVSFPWQLHVCSGEILSIKCFLLQCILLLSYFGLKEYDRLEWVLDIKTFVQNIFCKYMYHSFKNT